MNFEPIQIKRKLDFNLIFPLLIVIIINISVLFAAIYVDNEQKKVRNLYEDYNSKVMASTIVKNIINYNNNMSIIVQQYHSIKEIEDVPAYGAELQNKIDNITKSQEKVVYLTFDDGPSKSVTPHILETLKKNDVKATFFVLGTMVNYYPGIVKQEYEEGHYIANHGYSHVYSKIYENEEAFMNEVNQTEELIKEAIGDENYNSHLVRFPGRKSTEENMLI